MSSHGPHFGCSAALQGSRVSSAGRLAALIFYHLDYLSYRPMNLTNAVKDCATFTEGNHQQRKKQHEPEITEKPRTATVWTEAVSSKL